jgi:hypothetical protein
VCAGRLAAVWEQFVELGGGTFAGSLKAAIHRLGKVMSE